MTKKWYENDSLRKECSATVLSTKEVGDHFEIVLDGTVIFPEGGGQLSDQGWIDDIPVYYAAESGDDVRHFTHKALPVGEKVTVRLDWDVRLDRMQQHCGEHMLSYAFWKTCGANNVGFHMNEESVFIDLDKEVDEKTVKEAELSANAAVWENHPITLHYVPYTELGKYGLRKKNDKLRGIVRLVDIKEGDTCTCCGTHPPFTGMVGLIKVIRFNRYKGGSRIEFLCGKRAVEAIHERSRILEETSNLLSVKSEEVLPAVEKLHQEVLDLKASLRERTQDLFQAELPALLEKAPLLASGTRFVFVLTEGTPRDGKSLMKLLTGKEKILAALILKNGDKVMYQFAATKGAEERCRDLCTMAGNVFHGRGGGSPTSSQGGGIAGSDWKAQAKALEKAMLEALYRDAGWMAYASDIPGALRGLRGSLRVVTAWDDTALVGMARAIGDGETIVFVQDILVLGAYRRRGIGRALMRRLLDPFPAVRQIVLICEDTADTRGFYRACGFESLASLGCAGYVQFR